MPELEMDEKKLRSHIAAFEAALAAREPQIAELPLRRILLALDGSNQDATALRLTARLARRTGAVVLPLCVCAITGEEREACLAARSDELRRAGVAVETVADPGDGPAHAQILAAGAASRCDLLVVAAPYGEDFADLGHESVGTTLDILLCRAAGPLLIVREPKAEPEAVFSGILLPLTPALPANAAAGAWAIRLAEDGGALHLLAVIEQAPAPPAGPQPTTAPGGGAADAETAGLIAAVQRRAADRGLRCRVELKQGEEVGEIVAAGNAQEALLVLPCCPRDPAGPTFQRVQAIIRLSRNPVLMV